mgnify:CR=1 FL=1
MKKVVKFGGSSLASAKQFKKVGDIIRADKSRRYVVPSAPGKRNKNDTKVTDMLYACYEAASTGASYGKLLSAIKERYEQIIDGLELNLNLDYEFKTIEENFIAKKGSDYAASRGEYLNGIIMSHYLGYEFIDAIVGGAIPKEYIPAVDAGIQGAMQAGVLAGYPVVDVKVTLYDGSYHEVDSSEMAFKIAGSMAFKEACRKAQPVILEPIMKVSVIVPEEYMGDVIGDISARRGNILGMIPRNGSTQVDANVPLSQMFGYATDLRSRTQGRGQYSMEPSHYVELPKSIQQEIVEKRSSK